MLDARAVRALHRAAQHILASSENALDHLLCYHVTCSYHATCSTAWLRWLEPVALAIQFRDMMIEAIEQCAGEKLALENARPFLKRKIRRDYGRTLVPLIEYLKEQFRTDLENSTYPSS